MSQTASIFMGVALSIGGLGAFATDQNQQQGDWDQRYKAAIDTCIKKSQKQTACLQVIDGNPLDHASVPSEAFYDTSYESMYRTFGEGARAVSMARVLVEEDAPYWKRYNSELNYKALKQWSVYRAKKDNLEPCQRACLATCISSIMMEYDDRNLLTHWREGIGREKGVCREFSAMAVDLMTNLGLKSKTVTGTVYEIAHGRIPKKQGGHVMVQVALPNGNFVMEPQSPNCEFFDKKFSKTKRDLSSDLLNTKAL